MLKALQEVVTKAGGSMNEASRTSILSLLEADINEAEGTSCLNTSLRKTALLNDTRSDDILITKARLFGALVKYLPPANAKTLLK